MTDYPRIQKNILSKKDATKAVRISISYRKGGISYWDYSRFASAYYASITPIELENGFESFMLGDGVNYTLEESDRYSKNALLKNANEFLQSEKLLEIVKSVLVKKGENPEDYL